MIQRSITRVTARMLIAVSVPLVIVTPAVAQTFGGEIVESRTGQPLREFSVRLVRVTAVDSTTAIDSTVTDERGLFQIGGKGPGRYLLRFGPRDSRLETGAWADVASPDSTVVGRYLIPVLELGGARAYTADEVQRPAHPRPLMKLRYPQEMIRDRRTGEVVVRWILEPTGQARRGSVQVVRSTDPAFTRVVLDAMRTFIAEPGRIGGIAVPQVVEMPITFAITTQP